MSALKPEIHASAPTFFSLKYRSYSLWLGRKLRYSARRVLTFRISVTKFIDRDRRDFERCQDGNETTKMEEIWEKGWLGTRPTERRVNSIQCLPLLSLWFCSVTYKFRFWTLLFADCYFRTIFRRIFIFFIHHSFHYANFMYTLVLFMKLK